MLKATIIKTGHEESTGYRGDIVGIYPANILYIYYIIYILLYDIILYYVILWLMVSKVCQGQPNLKVKGMVLDIQKPPNEFIGEVCATSQLLT